jgi:hypothetical protein
MIRAGVLPLCDSGCSPRSFVTDLSSRQTLPATYMTLIHGEVRVMGVTVMAVVFG